VVVRSRPNDGGGYTFPAIVVCDSAEAIACSNRRGRSASGDAVRAMGRPVETC
jgi:hypothetical protein